MKDQNLSFEQLPDAVSNLLIEVGEIKRLLSNSSNNTTTKIYCLNSNDVIPFLKEIGIPMSRSKLYKLTSVKKIPCAKIGNQLVFEKDELINWANELRKSSTLQKDKAISSISDSARIKSNLKTNGK